MKINVNKAVLNGVLKNVSKAISKQAVIPALTGVHIVANDEGLYVTGSNSDLSIREHIPAEDQTVIIKETGSIILPAKQLSSIVRSMPGDDIKFEVDELKAKIKSGKSKFNLNGMNGENYPKLPVAQGKTFNIDGKKLISMIQKTVYAVSTNEARPVLTGANLYFQDNAVGIVATDSHRLARLDSIEINSADESFEETLTLPSKTLKELPSIIDDSKEVSIKYKNNQISFETGNLFVVSRLLEGNYPQTDRLIPPTYKTLLSVDRNSFLAAMERSSILADGENKIVKFKISDKDAGIFKTIELSQRNEMGESKEDILVEEIEGEELTVSFNATYMIDALKKVDDEKLMIEFNGSMRPFILKSANRPDFIQLILPVRTY